ncbi:aldehyde dehydrogenase family protein, partial [Salmonella enterica]|nr:aldehyde dehydrogenase family protein [Salmonella enterica]
CTAIRRVLVPESLYDAAAEAITARLREITVGNPRHADVRMGALVSRAQLATIREGLAQLQAQTQTLHDGANQPLIDADPAIACCIGPTLLGT